MISHRYRTLFIHIPKCAGSSIEKWFYTYAGAEHYSHENNPYLPVMRESGMESILNRFHGYFLFTFIRNPFDRFISLYEHSRSISPGTTNSIYEYAHLIHQGLTNGNWSKLSKYDAYHAQRQTTFLPEFNSNVIQNACHFIGRFECLQKDFNHLCQILGIQFPAPLYNGNKSKKRQGKHYSEYYDTQLRDLIEEIYAHDLDYFGYSFAENKNSVPSNISIPTIEEYNHIKPSYMKRWWLEFRYSFLRRIVDFLKSKINSIRKIS